MRILATRPLAAGAILGMLALTGCTALGGIFPGDDAMVLHLATIDGSVNPSGQYVAQQAFFDSLGAVSGGRITVKLTTTYGDGAVTAESDLVTAIAKGDIDGGWPSSRAFWRGGIGGLGALEAPMLITSAAAEKALVGGPIADKVRSRLRGSGIVGVGLGAGPLRRPFAAGTPLLGPDDWHRARFRVFDSQVQADVIRSFGGTPVNRGLDWIDRMRIEDLEGGEFDIAQAFASGNISGFGNVTENVVLWPKISVFSLSQKKFDSLTPQQRAWIQEAADRAVLASLKVDYDETSAAQALCADGVRFVDASQDQIAALRQRAESVLDDLETDDGQDSLVTDLRALAAHYPDPDIPRVSAECRQPRSDTASAETAPIMTSGPPDGLYRARGTTAKIHTASMSALQDRPEIWTLVIRLGKYMLSCRPLVPVGGECGTPRWPEGLPSSRVVDAGFVRGIGHTVFFVYDAALHASYTGCALPCSPVPTYRVTWTMRGNQLHFNDPIGGPSVDKLIQDWVKIG